MTMRASLIISAKDQASRAFGQIRGSAERMAASFRPVQQTARAADRAIDNVGRGTAGRFAGVVSWTNRMRDSFPAVGYAAEAAARPVARFGSTIARTTSGAVTRFGSIGSSALRMARDMRVAQRAAFGLGTAIGTTIRKTAGFAWNSTKVGMGAAAAATGFFLGGIIPTASKFEQFQTQLEGTEGSAKKAADAMNWVGKFAAQTPYEIDEVTDAFVRARGVGIDPFTGAMTKMGDAAAANRKTIMDTVEAIADAQTGEFERLKEFNITSSVKGDSVSFSFLDKAGKNAVRVTKKNAADIQRTILSIWDERHGGAMIRQSKTFEGIWRNLLDWVTLFQLRIANKGIFQSIKNDLAGVLDQANRLSDNGTLDRWAGNISDNLKSAWNWGSQLVRGTDWKGVASDVREIATASWTVATAFARVVGNVVSAAAAWSRWRRDVEKQNLHGVIDGWFTSERQRQDARVRLDEIREEENAASGRGTSGRVGPIVAPEAWAKSFSPAMQRKLDTAARDQRVGTGPRRRGTAPARVPGWMDNWNRDGFVQPGRRLPASLPAPRKLSAQSVQVGGKLAIEVKAAPGTEVRTRGLQTANKAVPITVRTGRSMAGAA